MKKEQVGVEPESPWTKQDYRSRAGGSEDKPVSGGQFKVRVKRVVKLQ